MSKAKTRNEEKSASAPATSGAVVTVALKHPTGVILEGFEKKSIQVPDGVGRIRDEVVFRSSGQRFEIHGNRVPFGKTPNFPIIGGYALTKGVPKDVWEIWLEQHKDSPLVENHLISAFESHDDAEAFATEHEENRSGMEAVLKVGDPRVDKRKGRDGKFHEAVVTADEQPAA